MANPDYATLLTQIAAASGAAKTALELQCYVFEEALTDTEKNLFNYVSDEYFLFNPGTRTNKGSSLTFSEMDTNFDTLAIQSMWIPAGAMYPSSTNPCAGLAQVETTALRPDLKVLDFDASSDEFAQFAVVWPNSWDKGTLTFKAFFTVATAKAHSGTSNDLNVTNESGAVTVSGSPVNDDMVFFQVQRDVSADNQSGDARLLGIKITFII